MPSRLPASGPEGPPLRSSPYANALRPFQRRLRLSAFVNQAPVVCAAALGVLILSLLVVRPDARVAALTSTTAIACAIVATWVMAVVRTPSLAATARTIDARFRLENRAITALQFSAAPDAVAHLVIADAMSRLETIPASRLPLDVSSRRWTAVAVLGCAALVVGMFGRPLQDLPRVTAFRDAAADSAVPSRGASARATGARSTRPDQTGGVTRSASSAAPVVPNARGRSGESASASPATPQPGNRTPDGAAPADGTPQGQPVAAPGRRAEGLTTEGGLTASGPDGRESGAGRGAAAGPAGPGRGAGAVATNESIGGGVAGGALATTASGVRTRPPAARFDAESYRRAYARAETAIARDQVPPRLRAYVRDYFTAIRQRSGQ